VHNDPASAVVLDFKAIGVAAADPATAPQLDESVREICLLQLVSRHDSPG